MAENQLPCSDLISFTIRNGNKSSVISFSAGYLRRQKEWLVSSKDENAAGIVHFLDALQDALVDDLGYSEEEVFGQSN